MSGKHDGRRTMDPWGEHIAPRLVEIEGWARDGVIDKDIAARCGIAYSTFKRHKLSGEHPELKKALMSKEIADTNVESALYKKAIGFSYNEITQETDTHGVMKITKVIKKEFPPDTASCIIWLTNRRGDKWKNRRGDDMDNVEALAKLDAVMSKVDAAMVVPEPEAAAPPQTEGDKPV